MDSHLQLSLLNSQPSFVTNFGDYDDNHARWRLIDSPYAAASRGYDVEEGDFYYGPGFEGYRNRQLYLHSYKFTRERSLSERLKSTLGKFKAAAWAVMACNYRPMLARKIKETFKSTAQSLRSGRRVVPLALALPKCVRISG